MSCLPLIPCPCLRGLAWHLFHSTALLHPALLLGDRRSELSVAQDVSTKDEIALFEKLFEEGYMVSIAITTTTAGGKILLLRLELERVHGSKEKVDVGKVICVLARNVYFGVSVLRQSTLRGRGVVNLVGHLKGVMYM